MPLGALVFDLDGTLVDSRRDLRAAVNRTRADLGLAPLTLPQVVSMVGEGARTLVRRALGDAAEGAAFEAAFATFLDHYGRVCLETTRPYPGVEALLERWGRRLPMALLTNKPEGLSRRILEGLGLAHHFRAVVGGDSLSTRKPDPEGLHRVAASLGSAAPQVVLVGDSRVDADTAHAAGCRFALVLWGFPPAAEMAAVEAEIRAADARQLDAALTALHSAAPADRG